VARIACSLLRDAGVILTAKGLRLQFAASIDQLDYQIGSIPSGSYPFAKQRNEGDRPRSQPGEQHYPALCVHGSPVTAMRSG